MGEASEQQEGVSASGNRDDPIAENRAIRRAVALGYRPGEAPAPTVIAQGSGILAERILELARQHRVPIRDDPLLVQALARLEVGRAIPPDLYMVVAEVFAWLYRLDRGVDSETGD